MFISLAGGHRRHKGFEADKRARPQCLLAVSAAVTPFFVAACMFFLVRYQLIDETRSKYFFISQDEITHKYILFLVLIKLIRKQFGHDGIGIKQSNFAVTDKRQTYMILSSTVMHNGAVEELLAAGNDLL